VSVEVLSYQHYAMCLLHFLQDITSEDGKVLDVFRVRTEDNQKVGTDHVTLRLCGVPLILDFPLVILRLILSFHLFPDPYLAFDADTPLHLHLCTQVPESSFQDLRDLILNLTRTSNRSGMPAIYGVVAAAEVDRLAPLSDLGEGGEGTCVCCVHLRVCVCFMQI